MNINDYGRSHEELIAIMSMPDSGDWRLTTCPCCGGQVEERQIGLRFVAITGDETLARTEYRHVDTVDVLWRALNRLLRECKWTRERNGYFVESRSGEDIGIGHMLREAEEAHTRYVHEHGQ